MTESQTARTPYVGPQPVGQINAGYTIIAALPMGPGEFIVTGESYPRVGPAGSGETAPPQYATWHAYAGANAVTGGWLYQAGNYDFPSADAGSRRHAMRDMAKRAGVAGDVEMYAVSARHTENPQDGDQWSPITRDVPTFYLLPSVQGITDHHDAMRVARDVVDPTGLGSVQGVAVRTVIMPNA